MRPTARTFRSCWNRSFLVTAFAAVAGAGLRAAELPDPKTGGAGGGPVAILFLSGGPMMDKAYAEQLTREGFAFVTANYYEPLKPEFIRRFNLIVVDGLPGAAEQFETFGQRMIHFRANLDHVWRSLQDGTGVLVYGELSGGGSRIGGWNEEMRRWGVQLQQACILDPERAFEKWRAYEDNAYCWTENLTAHPVTEGLKRIYYVTANLRWDDCYSAPPLVCDASWTPVVKAMPGAHAANGINGQWFPIPEMKGDLVLAAVRNVGQGRLAVFGLSPGYTHQMGYTRFENRNYGEMSYGVVDGIVLQKGDGTVPSDTGAFLSRLYGWLAGASVAGGFGGYQSGGPVEKAEIAKTDEERNFTPVLDLERMAMPRSWRHRPSMVKIGNTSYYPEFSDPFVQGDVQFFKALVGVHSRFSDGEGRVADYVSAAKQAGYSVIVFAENFERLSAENWNRLVAECEQQSTEGFACLPGFDIRDVDGNHFIIVAPPYYPRAAWLSPDGKRLLKTQMINLTYFNHLVIAHRPSTSPLPQERLKHFQGLSVFTYRDGQVVDDSLKAYTWQVMNGSNPNPIAVHEVLSPGEVARAATTGFQQIMPGHTARYAAAYFRTGIAHYFEAPARYLISEGPILVDWVINPKDCGPAAENRMRFRVDVGVRSDAALESVTMYDGPQVVRRWLPQASEFHASAYFPHSRQYGLYLIAEDVNGRRALSSSMRTVAQRYHFRCSDRQNWLGHVGAYYTGTYLSEGFDIILPVQGTKEASGIFNDTPGACLATKLNFPFTANDVVLTETIIEDRYLRAVFKDVGFDAMPSQASEPSTVYRGLVRRYSFTPGAGKSVYPTLLEFDLTLKREVEPVDPAGLFPSFGGLRDRQFAWLDATGQLVTGEIPPADTVEIPVGGMAGGLIALSPGLRVAKGQIGLALPAGTTKVAAGTRFQARLLVPSTHNFDHKRETRFDPPEAWLKALGYAGPTPYTLKLSRGQLESTQFPARVTPKDYGVAGRVTQTAELPFDPPLQISGLNPNWPAGSWRDGGEIVQTGIFGQTAWPRLDISREGDFYAGNLLVADRPDLVLEIIRWTKDAVRIEAHNPTTAPIAATVSTPREIKGYKPLRQKVTVPAGSTVYVP